MPRPCLEAKMKHNKGWVRCNSAEVHFKLSAQCMPGPAEVAALEAKMQSNKRSVAGASSL